MNHYHKEQKHLGTLLSLQVGLPKEMVDPETSKAGSRTWVTGMFKTTVSRPVWLGRMGLDGDGQADLEHHGGHDKAVNAYPSEHYQYWRRTLGLSAMSFGAFGENFTTHGLLEPDLCIGDIVAVGGAVVQVSQPRQPCWKLARRWHIHDLALQVIATGLTGWYFRVLREGWVQEGMSLTLLTRPCPEWPVSLANVIMHHRPDDVGSAQELALCRHLSQSWRRTLGLRAGMSHHTERS